MAKVDMKGMPAVQEAEAVVEIPVVNDSSEGLNRMLQELALPAARLRSAATVLLLVSLLFMGSIEGIFGLIAACGVLCCAAPGPLGTAYAARCTRIMATVAATLALMHVFCLGTFALAVMPEMPHAFRHACDQKMDTRMGLPADGVAEKGAFQISALFVKHLAPVESENLIATEGLGLKGAGLEEPKPVALAVATVASAASRRLQEFVPSAFDPESAPCERAERLFARAAPTFIWAAALAELCLFIAAMNTARAAGRLTMLARSQGANAM